MTAKPINQARDWVFRQVHSNNLVYNTCWEDPRCDRELMQFDTDSEIVMITSAGCNALDYLLDRPAAIHCVDVNPRQNALLELKVAAFERSSATDLFVLRCPIGLRRYLAILPVCRKKSVIRQWPVLTRSFPSDEDDFLALVQRITDYL